MCYATFIALATLASPLWKINIRSYVGLVTKHQERKKQDNKTRVVNIFLILHLV